MAAVYGQTEIAEMILEVIEDRHPKDFIGQTPFDIAVKRGNKGLCKIIGSEQD